MSNYFSNIDIGLMTFYTMIGVLGILTVLMYRDVFWRRSKQTKMNRQKETDWRKYQESSHV